jgi:hypothetical protein
MGPMYSAIREWTGSVALNQIMLAAGKIVKSSVYQDVNECVNVNGNMGRSDA